jgi:hypothetical protein
MKRIILVVAALALAPLAGAQLYKHVDKDGKVTYSDAPPAAADAKTLNIPKSALGDAPSGKSFTAQDKQLDKKRDEEKKKQAKADDASKAAEAQAAQCTQARAQVRLYTNGGKIYKADGSGDLMSDAEINSTLQLAKKNESEACKGR